MSKDNESKYTHDSFRIYTREGKNGEAVEHEYKNEHNTRYEFKFDIGGVLIVHRIRDHKVITNVPERDDVVDVFKEWIRLDITPKLELDS